jgi:hypothetical protein
LRQKFSGLKGFHHGFRSWLNPGRCRGLLLLGMISLSVILGWSLTVLPPGMVQGAELTKGKVPPNSAMVDPVPTRYQPGLESYLETCRSCHIALPPEVLPTESWREILRKPDNHYGVSIPNFNRFTQLLIWDYVSTFSRPSPPDAPIPLYVEKSRYFKVLHPRVTLPSGMSSKSCVICHPKALDFDFRSLTAEWQSAP